MFRFGIGCRDLRGAAVSRAKRLSVATFRGAMRVLRNAKIAGANDLVTPQVASFDFDVPGHCAVAQYCRYPVARSHCERVGSPGVDRRDHAVPVLPPLANHRIDGLVARCGARALGRD